MAVSIERLTNMLGQAHTAGDVEGATFLANAIRDFTPPAVPQEQRDEAGIENIPYAGAPLRVLSHPIVYEGGALASVIANTPEFLGRIPTQTFFSSFNYFSGNKKDNFEIQYSKNVAEGLANKIRDFKETGQEIPLDLIKDFKHYDTIGRNGISWKQASERGKIQTDKIVEEYLEKGALSDNIVNLAIDTFIPENPETKKKVLGAIEAFKNDIAKSDIIPSESTIIDESILGRALQGFGKLIEVGSSGLQVLGVPKDDADQIAALASLKAAPTFSRVVKGAKSRVGYTDAVNKVYGDVLRVPLLKSDKKKAEQTVAKLQTELEAYKEKNKEGLSDSKMADWNGLTAEVAKREKVIQEATETFNMQQYNFMGGQKAGSALMPDFAEATLQDLYEYQKEAATNILSKQGSIRKPLFSLKNDKAGLEGFKEITAKVAGGDKKVDMTTGGNIFMRMQNLFGKVNGFTKERQMVPETIRQYNEVVDVLEGTASKNIKLTKEQTLLKEFFEQLQKEDLLLTKKLQKEGIIDPLIKTEANFFPRKFVQVKKTWQENIFGDRFRINLGDRAPREAAVVADRVYFKLEGKNKKNPIFITLSQSDKINPRTGLPGTPIVTVNFRTHNGKKASILPNKDGSKYEKMAHELTEQASKLNEGKGLQRTGETLEGLSKELAEFAKASGKLEMKNVPRKEFVEVYPKELVTDPLLSVIESVNAKRQLLRENIYDREVANSAFGKRNIQIADSLAKAHDKGYDPRYPDRNVAKTTTELDRNNSKEVSPNQLRGRVNNPALPGLGNKSLSKRAADIIEDNFKEYKKGILSKVSDALVKNMMLNPIPHMHNELIHFYSTKGFLGAMGKDGVKNFAADQRWAMEQVFNRTPEYIDMLRSGRSQMSLNVINSRNLDAVLQQSTQKLMGDKATKKWYDGISKGLYSASKGYSHISDFAQYSMWTTRDVMYMSLVKQKMRQQKISISDAAKQVELHMPTYRLPETVGPEQILSYKVTRGISKFLQNPELVIFARYKHGMLSSGLNTAKDLASALDPVLSRLGKPGRAVAEGLGYKDIAVNRSKGKQFADGLDSGMALSSAWFIFYPLMDSLYTELFNGDEVKARRAGILHILETAKGVAHQKKEIGQLRQVLITINPAFLLMYELAMNETMYNGQEVYNLNDLFGTGSLAQFGKDVGVKAVQQIPQVSTLGNSTDQYDELDMKKFLGRQIDAKMKTREQLVKEAQRKARQDTINLNKALEGDYLEDYLEEYYKELE